jgi:regulation of enolase protein 1 (concanavalin A-like superfamily)
MRCTMLAMVALTLFPWTSVAAEPEVVFEDALAGKMDESWSWLREDPEAWRWKDDGLEIRIQPGNAATVRNALVRTAPDRQQGTYAIDVTVTNHTLPKIQYEQAGITWYVDGKPVFKLVKELVDGDLVIIPGRVPVPTDQFETIQLRLIVAADTWTAQFRSNMDSEFQTAANGKLPPSNNDQVSIQCYHGPTDAEHWIRFQDFRIQRIEP